MRFARCPACGVMRALVPVKRGQGSMIRTHYEGGKARYVPKMSAASPHRHQVAFVRCPGSQTRLECEKVLEASA